MPTFVQRNWFPALVSAIFIGPVAWWSLDNEPPLVVNSITVENPEVPRGGNLVMTYDVTRKRTCRGEVQRIFVDAKDTLIPIEVYRFNEGVNRNGKASVIGREVVRVSAPVPFGAAPGPAKYQAILEYFCNPLQRVAGSGIVVVTPIQFFTVKEQQLSKVEPPARIPGAVVPEPATTFKRYSPPLLDRLIGTGK